MKNNIITITRHHSPELESIISSTHEKMKQLAKKNGEHHARSNRPSLADPSLEPYTNDLKNGYQHLAATISKHLQPASHFPEARMDLIHIKEKDEKLNQEIEVLHHQNENLQYEVGDYNPTSMRNRIRTIIALTIAIAIGEVIYNTKAFQILGESQLFALIISLSISIAVLTFSHLIPFLIKSVSSKILRRIIGFGSVLLIIFVFIGLSIIRSRYLEAHGEHVSPLFFAILNVFFFIVGALFSFLKLPAWKDVLEHYHKQRQQREIRKRMRQIRNLSHEKDRIKSVLLERNKARLQITHYAEYAIGEVKSMYKESLGIFQSANLLFRTDNCVPQCFTKFANDIEVERLELSFTDPQESLS